VNRQNKVIFMPEKPEISLPSPQDHPRADIVIYDGKCVFCTRQVRQLLRLDGRQRLAFVSLHDPMVAASFPDLTHDQMMEQIYLIPHDQPDRRLGGAAVIRYLTTRLPKLWVFAPLLHLPFSLPLWQWAYRQVAKRRYRIANKAGEACDDDGTCGLHFKE
jgi:predicted DCC family thiol-disulfide oxidoreductase YuxK